jgi:hypothetical protein
VEISRNRLSGGTVIEEYSLASALICPDWGATKNVADFFNEIGHFHFNAFWCLSMPRIIPL